MRWWQNSDIFQLHGSLGHKDPKPTMHIVQLEGVEGGITLFYISMKDHHCVLKQR